ncbi:SMI1/KNR4 family protein [Chitinophaga rhizophila]|uniref:SMI1/KNR4 family protein n=1 Tax=Chitinophaga rhizophila TaxID=2866212 RepID=A0ABS7GJ86_9BACT|nr:SMI1/KNR4 family protein [Chitinophaga rhizophila]MBW8687754.1 SMI1/KNR4 family protein [Chitinophaga rhizophila]
MAKSTMQDLAEKLFSESDGSKFAKLKDKLIATYGQSDQAQVIEILTSYAKDGKLLHWRNFLMTDIISLVPTGDATQIPFFEWAITVPQLSYWAIDGLLKTKGAAAYAMLISLAQNEKIAIDVRAKAIKSLAVYSQQPFDRELPIDPGYWKIQDLRLDELTAWQNNGYTTGAGYAPPATHPSLHHPVTRLEHIAARIEEKLRDRREEYQDLSRPTDWLVPATDMVMAAIDRKWQLPADYRTFLQQFSPLHVLIQHADLGGSLDIYGAADLISRQDGYAFNSVTQESISDWPPAYLVIADMDGDPYCIDLTTTEGAIYTSMHGAGSWTFERYAESFLDFLDEVSQHA